MQGTGQTLRLLRIKCSSHRPRLLQGDAPAMLEARKIKGSMHPDALA